MVRKYLPKNIQELADWYMRYISPLSLIGGFFADNLILLRRVDVWTSNALLFFYLTVAGGCIVLINSIESGRLRAKWLINALPLIPVVAQFAFGGLFSGYLSLYSRSAAFALSWVFVAVVAVLLIGNERFVRLYRRFSFQIAMYFTVLFSFFIFFLPVVFHQIGRGMFLLSGVCALGAIAAFLFFHAWLVPETRKEWKVVARSIGGIYLIFNVLYFTNAIPPLPLALKDAGVYHSVSKNESGDYELSGESLHWYERYLRYNTVFHATPGESVYVYTAIFAPSGLTTSILHEWQRYDEKAETWVTVSDVSFPINGGRDGGYRGYSLYSDPEPGSWRVNVVTGYGQLVGRVSFRVERYPGSVPLIVETK